MSSTSEARSIRQVLETLVEQGKALPETEANDPNHPMYDSAVAGILSAVPDRPLVVDGRVMKPETVYETGSSLPDWQPGKERGLSVDETLKDFGIKGLAREKLDDKNRDR